ncbi:hypothetical protein BGZ65_000704 [Modicella reniformis]|uniref:Uncharacterized protein n=1 Tax=Modicella reniformis TaxID=1440133 RepID=A0A9P6MA27_9FUNG|nr:hypothetical protein BGZ65_000704 [Modicella reniformis]
MSKYRPLFELHQLVQLTHSSTSKTIFRSQVHLSFDDTVDEDEAGGWFLSAFTGKTYFEREYRREDLDDFVTYLPASQILNIDLVTTGDKDWVSFAKRFKKAILDGHFHVMDTSSRECKVVIDNEVHSRTGTSSSSLETIEIDMHPVSHASRGEKLGEFMFECASYIQAHGNILDPKNAKAKATANQGSGGAGTSADNVTGDDGGNGKGKNYDDLKVERDKFKTENEELRREIERLRVEALKSGSLASGGPGAGSSSRPKSKNAQMAMMVKEQLLKKRKGVSALNPRMKKGNVAKGTEFGSDDDDDEE